MSIYKVFPEGKKKALTMSYDDGMIYDERLVSIFNQNGIKGTFNLNYGLFDHDPERLPKSKIKELYKGHEVATHCLTHPEIDRCPLAEVATELLEDRKGLESLVGYPVRGHAYPFGVYTKQIEDMFHTMGIEYGRVVANTEAFELPKDPMEWKATCHHDHKLMELAKKFVEEKQIYHLGLMYVWGHSFEFARNDNWEVIEEFCSYIGGRDEIWYATNIQIIDYLKVWDRLQFAADNSFVYNPSVQSAWILTNENKVIEVKGGEQIELK